MDHKTLLLVAAPGHSISLLYADVAPVPERSRLMRNVVVDGTGVALSVELILLLGEASERIHSLSVYNMCLYPLPARHVVARGATAPRVSFPDLMDLSICTNFLAMHGSSCTTEAFFQLFSHMPRLVSLKLCASPAVYEHTDGDLRLPDPPFRLQSFSCTGGISLLGVARLIWCSRTTLCDLEIICNWDRTSNVLAESVLRSSVIRAAPGIRRLHVKAACTFLDLLRGSAGAFPQLAYLTLDGCSDGECIADAQAFIAELPRSLLRVSLPGARASFGEHGLRAMADRVLRG